MEQAKKGNTSMLIWLGKQYLGQTDKADHTTGGESLRPLNITVAKPEHVEKYKQHLTKLTNLN